MVSVPLFHEEGVSKRNTHCDLDAQSNLFKLSLNISSSFSPVPCVVIPCAIRWKCIIDKFFSSKISRSHNSEKAVRVVCFGFKAMWAAFSFVKISLTIFKMNCKLLDYRMPYINWKSQNASLLPIYLPSSYWVTLSLIFSSSKENMPASDPLFICKHILQNSQNCKIQYSRECWMYLNEIPIVKLMRGNHSFKAAIFNRYSPMTGKTILTELIWSRKF